MFAPTFGHASARRPPRRMLPLALLAAGLLLAGVGVFLLRDRLMGWVGRRRRGGDGRPGDASRAEPKRLPPARRPPCPRPRTRHRRLRHATPAPETTAAPPDTAPAPVRRRNGRGGSRPQTPDAARGSAPGPASRGAVAGGPEDSGPALTAVDKITFEAACGGTDMILWGNGRSRPRVYTQTRLDGNPPRELFKPLRNQRPFREARLVVGTPEVLQVRTGSTPSAGSELHVVLDLAHPKVTVTQVEPGPNRLRIHLQRQ